VDGPADAEAFLRDLLGALREGLLAARDLDLARDELARLAACGRCGCRMAPASRDAFAGRSAVRLPAANDQSDWQSDVP